MIDLELALLFFPIVHLWKPYINHVFMEQSIANKANELPINSIKHNDRPFLVSNEHK